jgi:plasmid stability protein
LDEDLLSQAKVHAAQTGRTLTALIEDALRQAMSVQTETGRSTEYRVATFRSALRPGVDLSNNSALADLMEEG